jgi:biopolymer transport protein ExbB
MLWLGYVVDDGIIGLLGVMSFFSVAFFVVRYLFFKRLDIARYGNDRRSLEIDITKRMSVIATIGSTRLRRPSCTVLGSCSPSRP